MSIFPDREPRSAGTGAAGFTLLEVVVAVAIAALMLVGLFRAGSGGLFATDTAARIEEAIERAQSRLAALSRTAAITPGELAGDDGGGYRWQVRIRPIAVHLGGGKPPTAQHPVSQPLALYDAEVTISWRDRGHNRSVVFETRRLGAALGAE